MSHIRIHVFVDGELVLASGRTEEVINFVDGNAIPTVHVEGGQYENGAYQLDEDVLLFQAPDGTIWAKVAENWSDLPKVSA